MLRIFDRLTDTPAEVVTELGETLRQTPLGVALTGDATRWTGPSRSLGYRWFMEPGFRDLYPEEDHPFLARLWVSGLREIAAVRGPGSRAAGYQTLLDPDQSHRLLVYTAAPGTDSYEKLQLLSVLALA